MSDDAPVSEDDEGELNEVDPDNHSIYSKLSDK